MRTYDEEDIKELNAEDWQVELLKMNPDYTCWGPHEDYMWKESGWDSRVLVDTWKEFGPWGLDDYNECVNFYFSVERKSENCSTCKGECYHPDAISVAHGFYAHQNLAGEHWNDKITQDEVEVLVKEGRLWSFVRNKPEGYIPLATEVNAAQRKGLGHDAINRAILIEARLKRLGLPQWCPACAGKGYEYTSPKAHVTLTLWMIHPRKGASRGVEVSNIQQEDLDGVFSFLNEARQRNAQRFSLIPSQERKDA